MIIIKVVDGAQEAKQDHPQSSLIYIQLLSTHHPVWNREADEYNNIIESSTNHLIVRSHQRK